MITINFNELPVNVKYSIANRLEGETLLSKPKDRTPKGESYKRLISTNPLVTFDSKEDWSNPRFV